MQRLLEKKNDFNKRQSSDPRFIPALDSYHKIKYCLDDNTDNRSEYGRALANTFWGESFNYSSSLILLGKSNKKPKVQPVKNTVVQEKIISEKQLNYSLNFEDDFYTNPISFSKNGFVYIGAGCDLFSYKVCSQYMQKIDSVNNDNVSITAVSTSSAGILYSLHDNSNEKSAFFLMDALNNKNIQSMPAQNTRHCVVRADLLNPHLFYAGNYWGDIARIDIREKQSVNYLLSLYEKGSEICGMSVCGDMFATGDNGDVVNVWDMKKYGEAFFSYHSHHAAVKALEFSPFNDSLLASAGGSNDQTLQIWDIKKQQQVSTQNTKKQTCNVHWMTKDTLFTTHGYGGSNGQATHMNSPKLHMWKLQESNLNVIASGKCDQQRILYSAQNPRNHNMFFTGSTQKQASLVKVKDIEDDSIFSSNRFTIR